MNNNNKTTFISKHCSYCITKMATVQTQMLIQKQYDMNRKQIILPVYN